MSQSPIDASSIVALLLVCCDATTRFNTPRAARTQTSRFQYVGSCVFYVLSSAGLFILLTWLLLKNPEALTFLHFGGSVALPGHVTKLAAPLIVALAMTTLLPSFPMLRDVDAQLLRIFHRMGSIPIVVAQWSKRMKDGQFVISDDLLTTIRKFIRDSKVLPDEIEAELRTDQSTDSARVTDSLETLRSMSR
jgi:hypothetical protein